jgi:nucleotide-binding universal stress UspA family protein
MKRDMPSFIKRIICPIDFSQQSRRALNNAIHLARVFNAELTVLTVIAPISNTRLRLDVQLSPEQHLIAEKQISKFEHFLKGFDFHEIKVIKEVYQGKPYQEILKRINARKSDLLVMGTNGRTGLSRILMGNITEKVIRELPCSFITLKEEDVIRLCVDTKISDLETHFKVSKQLLSKRFVKEALHQLQLCLHIDSLHIPAWEGMAYAHEQLGHKEKAQHCHNKVKEIRERLRHQEVELDLHRHVPFFKR